MIGSEVREPLTFQAPHCKITEANPVKELFLWFVPKTIFLNKSDSIKEPRDSQCCSWGSSGRASPTTRQAAHERSATPRTGPGERGDGSLNLRAFQMLQACSLCGLCHVILTQGSKLRLGEVPCPRSHGYEGSKSDLEYRRY